MATKTVYLPIILETDTEDEISDDKAKRLVNMMKYMMDDNFYNRDNMFDDAMDLDIPLIDITICKSKSFTDLTSIEI